MKENQSLSRKAESKCRFKSLINQYKLGPSQEGLSKCIRNFKVHNNFVPYEARNDQPERAEDPFLQFEQRVGRVQADELQFYDKTRKRLLSNKVSINASVLWRSLGTPWTRAGDSLNQKSLPQSGNSLISFKY